MSYALVVKPEAELDAGETTTWYEEQRDELGAEFLDELEETFNRIQENPFLFQERYKGVHAAFLRRFPFGVYFTVENTTILILAVLHTSRNPMIWKRRANQ